MTTIAFRGGVMACDSCWTFNGRQVVSATKIKRLASGALLGQSGDNDCREIEDMLAKVRTFEQVPRRSAFAAFRFEYGGLLALPKGLLVQIACALDDKDKDEDIGAWIVNRGFAAIGSGADVAIGAMRAGKGAREAVAIACTEDTASRLPVHVVELAKRKAK